MKLTIGSVVGPTSETHWGQVLHLPNACGVVEVSYSEGGARASGVHLLSKLANALADTTVSLHGLERIAQDAFAQGVQTILLCVPVGNVVYVVLRGAGEVYLKRGQAFATLLSGAGAVSGEVKEGDTIILASGAFSRTLTQEEARGIFDHLSAADVAERLTLLLHEKKSGTGSTALIMQFAPGEARVPPREVAAPARISALLRPRAWVRSVRAHPKRRMILITAALIVFFLLAVVAGIWKQRQSRMSPQAAAAFTEARRTFTEGVALIPLNPVKGRERLVSAKQALESLAKTIPPRSVAGRQIADLLRLVNDNLTQSMQIVKANPELFFDAALVKKGATVGFFGLDGTTMGLVDETTQTVYVLDVTSKNAQVAGGGAAFGGLSSVALRADNLYVLVDGGVNMIRLSDKKTVPAVISKDAQWGVIRSMVSYGGNLYLLDTAKSRIWKYVATESGTPAGRQGFSELREYLNPDTLPDLSKTTSLAIDGSVWLGSANGKLWKFTAGKEDTFLPQGVDPAFGDSLILYTNDVVNNLYVLDQNNKRVVVLTKDGTYAAQYVWTSDVSPTAMAVSEEQKKIYLLASGKIFTIPLK